MLKECEAPEKYDLTQHGSTAVFTGYMTKLIDTWPCSSGIIKKRICERRESGDRMKILIAEDDEVLAREIQMACTRWGFTVDTVQDFQQIAETLAQLKPDLLLLDINLPYYDGFYWCETIRRFSMLPILFISSRDQDQDKIMAMMSGGDDYLQKPFSLPLLMAKLQALLRRSYEYVGHTVIVLHESLCYDLDKGVLQYGSQEIVLTRTEHKILQILARNRGSIVSREELMMQIWSTDEFISDGSLTTGISRLKAKLRLYSDEDLIQTRKKQGYLLI